MLFSFNCMSHIFLCHKFSCKFPIGLPKHVCFRPVADDSILFQNFISNLPTCQDSTCQTNFCITLQCLHQWKQNQNQRMHALSQKNIPMNFYMKLHFNSLMKKKTRMDTIEPPATLLQSPLYGHTETLYNENSFRPL